MSLLGSDLLVFKTRPLRNSGQPSINSRMSKAHKFSVAQEHLTEAMLLLAGLAVFKVCVVGIDKFLDFLEAGVAAQASSEQFIFVHKWHRRQDSHPHESA